MSASAPSRSAMLARISAVQQMIGASALTGIPGQHADLRRAERIAQAKNFSDTSALIGAV